MREVDDPHDPEDEAQPRRDQKQHRGIEQRVEQVDEQDRHAFSFLAAGYRDAPDRLGLECRGAGVVAAAATRCSMTLTSGFMRLPPT